MAGNPYQAVAAADARKYGLPVDVFLNQIQQESGFNPNARSSAGAQGIAQFMPATAKGFGLSNPFDPVASLDAAARYDANLVGKYGTIARALSAYNSGRPDAYKDPNFAGGQTFNYVRSILGGTRGGGGGGAAPAPAPARSAPGLPTPSAGGQSSGIGALLARIIGQTNESLGLGSSPGLASLFAGTPARNASPPQQAAPQFQPQPRPSNSGGALASLDGIQVDPRIASEVSQIVKRFGVTPTSGYRSPQHNAAVGGAENSDHLRGDAVDFSGSPKTLQALYQWAQGRFPYVEPMAQAKNHAHISFIRP